MVLMMLMSARLFSYSPEEMSRILVNAYLTNSEEVIMYRDGEIVELIDIEYYVKEDCSRYLVEQRNADMEMATLFLISIADIYRISQEELVFMNSELEIQFSSHPKFLRTIAVFLRFNKVDMFKAGLYGQMFKAFLMLQ
jgi:hypothetical protein